MLLYRIVSALALLLYAPYALARSLSGRRRLGSLRGRLGLLPYPDLAGGLWLHAVSVGEVRVARNLAEALARRSPDLRIGLSATTAAGLETARKIAGDLSVFAFPLDLSFPVRRALSGLRPGLLALTETELWPLLIDRASARGVPVAVVNGRISEKSLRRYRLARRWFARVLSKVSLFAMQSEEDARRIRELGAAEDRILVTGNVKYDVAPAPAFADALRLRSAAGERPVLVAGSTGDGEEEIVLEAWKTLDPRPLLAIAPRRPERFEEVARLIESHGFSVVRRSSNHQSSITSHQSLVYLLDTIGELASLYREADLAFLGGSLVPSGGHNPIEAWAQGVPVLVGPHVENFRDVTRAGEEAGILIRVPDGPALAAACRLALGDPARTAAKGERARAFVGANRGAAQTTAEALLKLLRGGLRERAAAP